MYSALNTFSEYTYFYILKNITSNTSIASFKNYQKSSVCPQPKSLRKTHKKNGLKTEVNWKVFLIFYNSNKLEKNLFAL